MKHTLAIIMALTICTVSWGNLYAYAQDITMDSGVDVLFKEGEGPTKPVDPEEPEKPLEPEPPPVDGTLVIVYASDLEFGEFTITPGVAGTIDVKTQYPNVQVVDLRGTGKGWLLQAKLSSFKDVGNTTSLNGAAINIKGARMNAEGIADIQKRPLPQPAYLTSDDTTVDVVVAQAESGTGLWVTRFYPETPQEDSLMQLYVPIKSITKGAHHATITWKLVDDPTGAGQ